MGSLKFRLKKSKNSKYKMLKVKSTIFKQKQNFDSIKQDQ